MERTFWTSERLMSFSAILISLCTFLVFVYQTSLIRKQQYMSVYPHLEVSNHNSGSLNYKYVLTNEGVGPAFITEVKVWEENGKSYQDFLEYVSIKAEQAGSLEFHYTDLGLGSLIQANEDVFLFGLSGKSYTEANNLPTNTIESAHRLRAILNDKNLKWKITYESIYGESWFISHDNDIPIKN